MFFVNRLCGFVVAHLLYYVNNMAINKAYIDFIKRKCQKHLTKI